MPETTEPGGLPNSELESLHVRLDGVAKAFEDRNDRLTKSIKRASSLLVGDPSGGMAGDENVKRNTGSLASLATILEEEAATYDRLLLDLEKVIGVTHKVDKDASA
jgi:hypothetical protein